MLTLTDRDALRRAIRDPTLDLALRAVLKLRFKQLGGTGADFHVAEPTDSPDAAETAVGWPLALDDAPCWEWVRHHPGGWIEIVFVLSDDGSAQVLLAHDRSLVADRLRAIEATPPED